jgi:beta-phosphoglucomutase-like phosphatase (HAD superfamily)
VLTAVVFDFDGLILDTETPIYRSWADAYGECGIAPLTLEEWAAAIGTAGGLDPRTELERRAAGGVPDDVLGRRQARRDALLAAEVVRPGVRDWLAAAHRLGLPVGLASSSGRAWVEGHLRRLGIFGDFDAIACYGDTGRAAGEGAAEAPAGGAAEAEDDQHVVAPHDGGPEGAIRAPPSALRPKPAPDLYLAVCEALGAAPAASLAVEDSPNGIQAARAAGLRCVAVPNAMTRMLDLGGAHLVVESLSTVTLAEAIEAIEAAAADAKFETS